MPAAGPVWTDAALKEAGAADKLIAAADAAGSLSEALSLLEKNAPRLPEGAGKRDALISYARYSELSGDTASAADAWYAAAFSEPGRRDDFCLLDSARCLAAVGDMEKASATVRTVLLTSKDSKAVSRARLLSAYLAAFARENEASSLLSAFIDEAEYAQDRPTILFMLAQLCADESARRRLVAEHPAAPEALIAGAGSKVDLAAIPLWLLSPGRGAISIRAEPSPPTVATIPPVNSAASFPHTEESARAAASSNGQGPIALQVGLFKAEPNALALIARLTAKGFAASSAERTVNGQVYWSVSVEPGRDSDATMLRLKDAGFESFPLF